MRVFLRQTFPLGRFHATPWRVNPFDDPFGEWPPSPWRLVRAVCARWFQWQRETGRPSATDLDSLMEVLCRCQYSYRLPAPARRSVVLRQYVPAAFGWNPGEKKKPGIRAYGTSLVQDNAWCVPSHGSDDAAVWWILDGAVWTSSLLESLDRCLERILYFGRAESLTSVSRCADGCGIEPNCRLTERVMSAASAPVLAPTPEATREDIVHITDDQQAKGRTVPPGARWMYAELPETTPTHEQRSRPRQQRTNLIQFAVGFAVPPDPLAVARFTTAFRSRVITAFLRAKAGNPRVTWSTAPTEALEAASGLSGKGFDGAPLSGHRHAAYLGWLEDGQLTRLVVWRPSEAPFTAEEHAAILRAAARELSWTASGANTADEWRVRLVPLDRAVSAPSGFGGQLAATWISATPYIPPRHHIRKGRLRDRECIAEQVRREIHARGIASGPIDVAELGTRAWVDVHRPTKSKDRKSSGRRRGYWLRLHFDVPVPGPIMLGHSSHFGLGLFVPEDSG